MELHDPSHHRQPQTGSPITPSASFVYFIKTGPDFVQLLCRNRLPAIKYFHPDLFAPALSPDAQLFALIQMVDGIVQVVDHHLLYPPYISPHRQGPG